MPPAEKLKAYLFCQSCSTWTRTRNLAIEKIALYTVKHRQFFLSYPKYLVSLVDPVWWIHIFYTVCTQIAPEKEKATQISNNRLVINLNRIILGRFLKFIPSRVNSV